MLDDRFHRDPDCNLDETLVEEEAPEEELTAQANETAGCGGGAAAAREGEVLKEEPASEGKAKVTSTTNLKFQDTDFKFNDSVRQVVNLLELIDEEDLRSIYGTSQEMIQFHSSLFFQTKENR